MEVEGIGSKNEKIIEELQQRIVQIETEIFEIKIDLRMLDYEWGFRGDMRNRSSELDVKKMELDILTFAHKAYPDKKKNVLSFSSEKPEVNIHNLNYRILHESRSIHGERRLLNMMNPKKNIDSGLSLEEHTKRIWRVYDDLKMEWRNVSIIEREKIGKKQKELEKERDQLYGKSPIKGSLWNSLPYSARDLRIQIQALEAVEEEKRIVVLERRKKVELKKREVQKAENDIKSLRKMIEKIHIRKQRDL